MYQWHLGHRVLLVGVLVSLLESSSSTTIGLWKEPSGALGWEGPELFEDWEIISGCRLDCWTGEGREDELGGIIGGDRPVLWWWQWFLSSRRCIMGCRIVSSPPAQASWKDASANSQRRASSFCSCCKHLSDSSSCQMIIWQRKKQRLRSCLGCLFDQWVVSKHVKCQWW